MEEPEKPSQQAEDSKWFATGIRYSSVVFEFVGILLICGYVGTKIDDRYAANPWGILGGLLVGMAAGLFVMIKQLNKLNR